jgi:hypothetical protein
MLSFETKVIGRSEIEMIAIANWEWERVLGKPLSTSTEKNPSNCLAPDLC